MPTILNELNGENSAKRFAPERVYFGFNAYFNFSRALYISTYSLYLVNILGLPISWISWLVAIDLAFSTLSELPAGAFADIRGRKSSFVLACVVSCIGYLLYAVPGVAMLPIMSKFAFAAFGEMVLAVGFAFYSGALESWMADHPERKASLQEIYGRANAFKNVAYVIGGIAGVAIYRYSPIKWINCFSVAFVTSGIVAIAAAFLIKADVSHWSKRTGTARLTRIDVLCQMRIALRRIRSSSRLKAVFICSSASVVLLQILVVYWPTYMSNAMSELHVEAELAFVLAFAWLVVYGSRAIGSYITATVWARRSPLVVSVLSVLMYGLPVFGLVLTSEWLRDAGLNVSSTVLIAIVLYATCRFGEGAGESLRTGFFNEMVATDEKQLRTTMASVGNAMACLGAAIIVSLMSCGVLLGASLLTAFLAAAVINLLTIFFYPLICGKNDV